VNELKPRAGPEREPGERIVVSTTAAAIVLCSSASRSGNFLERYGVRTSNSGGRTEEDEKPSPRAQLQIGGLDKVDIEHQGGCPRAEVRFCCGYKLEVRLYCQLQQEEHYGAIP